MFYDSYMIHDYILFNSQTCMRTISCIGNTKQTSSFVTLWTSFVMTGTTPHLVQRKIKCEGTLSKMQQN